MILLAFYSLPQGYWHFRYRLVKVDFKAYGFKFRRKGCITTF